MWTFLLQMCFRHYLWEFPKKIYGVRMIVHIAVLMNIILIGMPRALPEAREALLGYFNNYYTLRSLPQGSSLKIPLTLALAHKGREDYVF